jgi:hypothetical protein
MSALTLKFIRTFNPIETKSNPDLGDTQIDFDFSNGVTLSGFTQINYANKEVDSLEGFDGFLYIETQEKLEKVLSMSFSQVIYYIAESDKDFDTFLYI